MQLPHYFGVFLKGLAMGAADVVPGVSGGTIAFITGIYDELLNSIKSINPSAAMTLFKEGPAVFWRAINGNFLISLIAGIVVSFLSLAHLITYLMAEFPLLLWSFFFGLVIASALHIARELNIKCPKVIVMVAVGGVFAFWLTASRPVHIEPTYLKVFAAGALAICAMILPGISGSFILLLLGLYGFVLESIKGFDLVIISCFAAGCATGLLSFVHLLSWLLNHFRLMTMALLTGFLFGSLNALWPWKQVIEYYESSKGLKPLVQENILPWQYASIIGDDAMLLSCIALMAAGIVVVFGLERFSK